MRLKILIIAMLVLSGVQVVSGQSTSTTLIPIGAGYGDTFDGLIAAVAENVVGDTLKILVLPTTYSTDAETISDEERQTNIDDADARRSQIEEACIAGVPADVTCEIVLAPIFTRSDAEDEANLEWFTDELTAVYILGGDQTVAMLALANTPVEQALADAYQRGVIIAGTSAGLAMQSQTMIGGYVGEFGPETGVSEGAVDVWNSDEKRGLSFGLPNVILEQHLWERSRLGRLLNAIAQPDVPHVGIGIDSYTAAKIVDGTQMQDLFGLYGAAIVDAETYSSADAATFGESGILSIRNILFHTLAPGEASYDLASRQHSFGQPAETVERSFDSLSLPEGAGSLTLTGGSELPTMEADDETLILVTAYTEPPAEISPDVLLVSPSDQLPGLETFTTIVVYAADQSLIDVEQLQPIVDAWLAGADVQLHGEAAAIAGAYYSAQGPIPEATDDEPYADIDYIQGAFQQGKTNIQPGLGMLDVMIEPRLMADYRWGRLVSLAYNHPQHLAVGLSDESVLNITEAGTRVDGENGVFVLDLSGALLNLGTNEEFVIANGLLDVFAPGDELQAVNAVAQA